MGKYEDEDEEFEVAIWVQLLTSNPSLFAALERSKIFQQKLRWRDRADELRGRKCGSIASLVEVLRIRKIPLTHEQVARLQWVPLERLPDLKLAMEAKSADDFMRRAGFRGECRYWQPE